MPTKTEEHLRLRIILKSPPPGVDFGLQKGHGNSYEVIGLQRSSKGDLSFELEVELKPPAGKSAALDFKGPFVQGKAGERFFYIDIGTYAGQTNAQYSRKLKIPLRGISKSAAQSAIRAGEPLQTSIAGTGKDGGPACATPKDFSGWKLG
jgi:hypothetical protein